MPGGCNTHRGNFSQRKPMILKVHPKKWKHQIHQIPWKWLRHVLEKYEYNLCDFMHLRSKSDLDKSLILPESALERAIAHIHSVQSSLFKTVLTFHAKWHRTFHRLEIYVQSRNRLGDSLRIQKLGLPICSKKNRASAQKPPVAYDLALNTPLKPIIQHQPGT